MKKVFLGGTCNESTWRELLICGLEIDYFNPMVEDWTPECMEEERWQRKICDYVLYVITPRISGVYSIAEVVDDSNKRPEKTIFCFLPVDYFHGKEDRFDIGQMKSLQAVADLVKANGGKVFKTLAGIRDYLNTNKREK